MTLVATLYRKFQITPEFCMLFEEILLQDCGTLILHVFPPNLLYGSPRTLSK